MYGTNSFASKTDDTSWRVRNAPELLSRMARQASTSVQPRQCLCEHPRAQLTYPKAHSACDFCGQVLHKRLKFLHCDMCALAACSTCCGAHDDPVDMLAEQIDYQKKKTYQSSHEACTHSNALLTPTPYASGGVRCDVCGQTTTTYPGGALYLHCEGCQFDVCTTCRSYLRSGGPTAQESERGDYKQRLQRYYQHYNPGKLADVDATVAKYAGREEDMFAALVQKYGPESPLQQPQTVGAVASPYRDRLVRFYQQYNTEKLSTLDVTLAKFGGREEEMFQALVRKYGPEPRGIP
jgi:hypothetical protein